jgi:hypothetical protein
VRCPTCRKAFEPPRPRPSWFPFCAERCQLADLGKWLDEEYRVAEPAGTSDMTPSADERD